VISGLHNINSSARQGFQEQKPTTRSLVSKQSHFQGHVIQRPCHKQTYLFQRKLKNIYHNLKFIARKQYNVALCGKEWKMLKIGRKSKQK